MTSAAAPATERRNLLGRLLDESTEPLLALDEHGAIRVANAAAAALLGRDRPRLRGKSFAMLVSIDDRRPLRRALLELGPEHPYARLDVHLASDALGAQTRPIHLRHLQGRPRVVAVRFDETQGPPAPDEGTPPPAFVQLELERILLRLPNGVIGIDASGCITFANARARRLFQPSPIRRGRPLPPAAAGVSLEPLVKRLLDAPGTLPSQLVEFPEGRTVRITGTGADGALPALLVLDDITRDAARTAADRLFVQNAAHQLRTPLAGIANAVELLQAGAKDDPRARDRFLAHLERETGRLTRLARSLLVLARAQSGVQAPRLDFVELEPLLRRIAERLETAKEVDVVVDCGRHLTALAEPDLLEEALTALAENAARHTRRGTIRLGSSLDDEGRVAIAVEDSGDGILPEHQELLFEPFFRGAADGDGFGLGLAIAAQAVATLGATLDVDSAPQRGATFSFRLPAAQVVTA